MLRLWIDILRHSCIYPSKIHDASIQCQMWSLNLSMYLKELARPILNHYLKILLNSLWFDTSKTN